MITKVSESIAYFFAEKGFFEKEHVKCYVYGFYYIISETLYWLLFASIAFFADRVIESIVYMFVFINIRHCAGGYHANTRAKCNIIFTITYLLFLGTLRISLEKSYVPAMLIAVTISMTILLLFAPVKPANKKCTDNEMEKYRQKTIAYSVIFSMLVYICGLLQWDFAQKIGLCITLAMVGAALSVFVIIFRKGGKGNETF